MRKPVVYSVLVTALLFMAGPLYAGDPAVININPPSAVPSQLPGSGPDLHEGKFDGYGTVDRITPREVVINDTLYRLSSTAAYQYLDGRLATAEDFPVGTRVWFVLYADNIIKSVWKEGG